MKTCAVCQKKQTPERMVFSRWTGLSYCLDVKTCVERQARRLRASRAERESANKEQAA